MEVDLANILFGWLLHIDLANIASNSDPSAKDTAIAITTGIILVVDPTRGPRTRGGPPPDPHTQHHPNQFDPPEVIEDTIRQHEEERQRLRDHARNRSGGSTAPPPPPPQPTTGGIIHRGIRGGIQSTVDNRH